MYPVTTGAASEIKIEATPMMRTQRMTTMSHARYVPQINTTILGYEEFRGHEIEFSISANWDLPPYIPATRHDPPEGGVPEMSSDPVVDVDPGDVIRWLDIMGSDMDEIAYGGVYIELNRKGSVAKVTGWDEDELMKAMF